MSSVNLDQHLRQNAVNQPDVMPSIIAQRIEETLQALPERATVRKRAFYRKAVYAAASILLLAGSLAAMARFAGPEVRSEMQRVPVLGSLVTHVRGDALASVSDEGVRFTVNKVLYDGNGIAVQYSVRSEVPLQGELLDFEMKMDGIPVGSSIHPKMRDEKQSSAEIFSGMLRTDLYDYRPPAFELKLDITKIGGREGHWSVTLPVERTSIGTRVIETDIQKANSLFSLRVERVKLSPVSGGIEFNLDLPDASRSMAIGLQVISDTGEYAETNWYGSMGPDSPVLTGKQMLNFPAVNENARFLTIRPLFFDMNEAKRYAAEGPTKVEMTRLPTENNPIELTQGNAGKLYVTGVEYFQDRTVVRYRVEGSNSRQQAEAFWVELGDGKLPEGLQRTSPNYMGDQILEFEPVSADTKLTFATRPIVPLTYYPDMDIRIDLSR